MNTARTHTGATALLDGRVLVAGGLFMDRASEDRAQVLDSGELWDPRSGAWVRTRPLAGPRFKASAVTLTDGRVLIVGGSQSRESDPIPLGSTEIYDPPSDRWSSAGTLAVARRGFALVALPDGGALVVGGLGGVGRAQSERVATVERFDAATKEWSRVQDLPYPVVGASAIRLADGRVLVAGGSVRPPELLDAETGTYVSGLTADALLFDPRTGRWTATTPMPIPRADASAVVLSDGSVVLVGGSAAEGEPNSTPGCSDPQPEAVRYVPGS
jgi:N-acetylneuraminic acid mutarotase